MESGLHSEAAAETFDANYYASHCGPYRYDRSEPFWGVFFGRIAETLIRSFRPAKVFDAGCALGFLVEAFWDRGVECWGRDISEYGVSQIRADVRPFCNVGSIADPIEGKFDLVTCIEVVEHMPEAEARLAIKALTAAADRILFSSSPEDLTEPTHVTVRPAIYWIRLFAEQGFSPVLSYDATFIIAHATIYERTGVAPSEDTILGFAEMIRIRTQLARRDQTIYQLNAQLDQLKAMSPPAPPPPPPPPPEPPAPPDAEEIDTPAEAPTDAAPAHSSHMERSALEEETRKSLSLRIAAAMRHPFSSSRRKSFRAQPRFSHS